MLHFVFHTKNVWTSENRVFSKYTKLVLLKFLVLLNIENKGETVISDIIYNAVHP